MNELTRAVAHLRAGGLIAVATESSFGLMASASDPAALARLFDLKGRSAMKGVALIIDSVESWRPLVTDLPDAAVSLAAEFWPGPLSIALPAAPGVDERLVVDHSVAVRIPGASPALDLVRAFGAPLTATSANFAGEPPLCTAAEVQALLGSRCVELVVMSGSAPGGPPSTLVRLENGAWVVLRPGAIHPDRLPDAVQRRG